MKKRQKKQKNLKRAGLSYKGKSFYLDLRVCRGLSRFSGLMFTSREKAKALLFDFEKPVKISVHSFFVFFPFAAIWLDSDGKVIDFKMIKPFSLPVFPSGSFSRLVEVPLNRKYAGIIEILVGQTKI